MPKRPVAKLEVRTVTEINYDMIPDPLTPGDIASLFGVDPKTVSRWANEGKFETFRTLGGHRRFHREQVINALKGE